MNGYDDMYIDYKQILQKLRNGGALKWLGVIIAAIFVIIAIFSSIYTVEAEGNAVVKRFGEVIKTTEPGLHFKLPFGIDKAYFVPTKRVLKEEFGFRSVAPGQRTQYSRSDRDQQEALMLTGDLNVINVEWVVQYKIVEPNKYLHQVRNPTETLRDISEAVMRRIVGNNLGREVLTVGRGNVSDETREEMQKILDSYDIGISLQAVRLQDVTPPETVKPAFNDVNEARQEKERLINEAEKYRNQVIPKAKGEAEQTIAEAEAYRAERTNKAKGGASRFTAVRKEYEKAKDVTRRRLYLEAVEEVLPKLGNVFVIGGEGTQPLPLFNLDNVKKYMKNKN